MLTAIEKIYDAARMCGPGSIDEELYLDNDVGFNVLINYDIEASPIKHIDVPVSAITCLVRNDFYFGKAKTWRDAVKCLNGNGWSDDVFNYFENDLFQKPFPPPDSKEQLQLRAVGGLVNCVCGTHRIVAAKAWLLNTQGEAAVLKNVSIEQHQIDQLIEPVLSTAINANEEISISIFDSEERSYMKIDDESVIYILRIGIDKFFARTAKNLHPLKNKFHFADLLTALGSRKKSYGRKNWKDIPRLVVVKALKKNW